MGCTNGAGDWFCGFGWGVLPYSFGENLSEKEKRHPAWGMKQSMVWFDDVTYWGFCFMMRVNRDGGLWVHDNNCIILCYGRKGTIIFLVVQMEMKRVFPDFCFSCFPEGRQNRRRCVIICNLLRCYQDSGSAIYANKLTVPSPSVLCILHILTYLTGVVSKESFWHSPIGCGMTLKTDAHSLASRFRISAEWQVGEAMCE